MKISSIFVGEKSVSKIYLGDFLIFNKGSSPNKTTVTKGTDLSTITITFRKQSVNTNSSE